MDNGWISLYRKILEWEWWDDHNTTRLFIYILIKANHQSKKWKGIDVNRGQHITSRDKLSLATGLSHQQVRTALNKLISTNEVTINTTNNYTVISVNNYENYQGNNQPDNQRITNKQPTDNQRITTNNNDNKENNDNNNTYIGKVYENYRQRINSNAKLTDKGRKKILTRLKSYSVDDLSQAMANFSADNWWVENNAHRGVAWFFDSDDRIEQFLLLKTARLSGRQQARKRGEEFKSTYKPEYSIDQRGTPEALKKARATLQEKFIIPK
jgi:hypothetical protein